MQNFTFQIWGFPCSNSRHVVLHYSQAASRVGVCGPVHSITTLPIGFEQPVGKNNGNYHTVSQHELFGRNEGFGAYLGTFLISTHCLDYSWL